MTGQGVDILLRVPRPRHGAGHADLVAVTPLTRLMATAEAVTGQVYPVPFVAMLVGLRA